MKRIVAVSGGFILMVIAAIQFLIGCSENNRNSDPSTIQQDVLSFTVYQPNMGESAQGSLIQDRWLQMMEDYMELKLEISWKEVPWSDFLDRQSVYIASGDFADVFLVVGFENILDLGDNGLIVNLNDFEKYMPHYSVFLHENYGEQIASSAEGSIYGFLFGGTENTTGTQHGWGYRYDLFKKHDINLPENIGELRAAAEVLKKAYPTSYPISAYGGIGPGFTLPSAFFMANKTHAELYYNGNQYVLGPVDDAERFKATLEYMHNLYEEGLIDPEFITHTHDQYLAKCLNGTSFISVALYSHNIDKFNNDPESDALWVVPKRPKSLWNEVGWKIGSNIRGTTLSTFAGTVISSKASNPELLIKLIDYQYSEEIMLLITYGIEGTTFAWTPEGKARYVDKISKAGDETAISKAMGEFGLWQSGFRRPGILFGALDNAVGEAPTNIMPTWDGEQVKREDFYGFYDRVDGSDSIFPFEGGYFPPIRLTQAEREKESDIMTPIYTYINESVARFILGELSLAEYEDFVRQIEKLGDWRTIKDLKNRKTADFIEKYR